MLPCFRCKVPGASDVQPGRDAFGWPRGRGAEQDSAEEDVKYSQMGPVSGLGDKIVFLFTAVVAIAWTLFLHLVWKERGF